MLVKRHLRVARYFAAAVKKSARQFQAILGLGQNVCLGQNAYLGQLGLRRTGSHPDFLRHGLGIDEVVREQHFHEVMRRLFDDVRPGVLVRQSCRNAQERLLFEGRDHHQLSIFESEFLCP